MVPGLRKFIEKQVPDARQKIDIYQEIEQWKCDNPNSTPIIVISFGNFYRSLCLTAQAQVDELLGRHDRSIKILEIILQRFQSMGVQLKFFLTGPPDFIKNPDLVNFRRTTYMEFFDIILEMIELERTPEFIVQQLSGPIYNNASYFIAAIMLAEKYGEVHKSFHNKGTRDMALYALKHNALAIMSGSYDFILMTGQLRLWDIKYFDSSDFKIIQIDKTKVRDFLELSDENLPIVGILTGKYYLPKKLVYNFLKSLGSQQQTFQNVAKFINKHFCDNTLIVPNVIAQFLNPYDVTKNAKIAENALKHFANRPDLEPTVEDELSVVTKRLHSSFVYEYLNDLPARIETTFLSELLYPKFITAALQIHKRQMGVVLQHKDNKNARIVLYNFSNKPVFPVYPGFEVPPLLRIYQETADNALHKTKLKLVSWIASDKLSYRAVKNLPKPYLCAILTLVNLTENQFITGEEADCILYCLQQYNLDPAAMNLLKYPDSIAKRPFEVIFLYDIFHYFMVTSMYTVGLADMVVYNQLDGVYFHQQYEKFIHMSGAERDVLLETVQSYRLY